MHTQYLRAVVALAEHDASGAPLREGLLLAAVERLLEVDADVNYEELEAAEGEEERLQGGEEDVFDFEDMSQSLDEGGQQAAAPGTAQAAHGVAAHAAHGTHSESAPRRVSLTLFVRYAKPAAHCSASGDAECVAGCAGS